MISNIIWKPNLFYLFVWILSVDTNWLYASAVCKNNSCHEYDLCCRHVIKKPPINQSINSVQCPIHPFTKICLWHSRLSARTTQLSGWTLQMRTTATGCRWFRLLTRHCTRTWWRCSWVLTSSTLWRRWLSRALSCVSGMRHITPERLANRLSRMARPKVRGNCVHCHLLNDDPSSAECCAIILVKHIV